MGKTHIQEVSAFGQSVWLDNLSRSHIKTGKLKGMIESGLLGITSNPTIFDNAISKSSDSCPVTKVIDICEYPFVTETFALHRARFD